MRTLIASAPVARTDATAATSGSGSVPQIRDKQARAVRCGDLIRGEWCRQARPVVTTRYATMSLAKCERLGHLARPLDLGCGRNAEHRGGNCDVLRARRTRPRLRDTGSRATTGPIRPRRAAPVGRRAECLGGWQRLPAPASGAKSIDYGWRVATRARANVARGRKHPQSQDLPPRVARALGGLPRA